jgi:uncharacterized membrane protein
MALDLAGAMWIFTNYLPVLLIVFIPALITYRKYGMVGGLVGANIGVICGFWFGPAIITLQIVILTFLLDALIIYPKIKEYIPSGGSEA